MVCDRPIAHAVVLIAYTGHPQLGSKFLDPFGLFGAYALKKQRERMAGIYCATDSNLSTFFNDVGLINLDPLSMSDNELAEHLEQAERGESHLVNLDESTVGVPEGVELQYVSSPGVSASLPLVDGS